MKSVVVACCITPLVAASSAGADQKWKPLGPALINNRQAWPGRVQVTGRINVVTPNPHNRLGDIWIGSATGGVWHGSIYPNIVWKPMTDRAASLAVGAIRLDSCSAVRCQTVWVGTGENSIRRDTQHGRGVLRGKWTGRGYTWQLLGEEHFARGSITGLVLDPSTPDGDSKRLYVALSSGVTSNATHSTVTTTPSGPYGIWKSNNAGQTWINVLESDTPATDLEMDPHDPQTLFAGLRNKGLYRSTDGGQKWEPIHNGIPTKIVDQADWPEIAVHRTPAMDQAILYAVLGKCPHPHTKVGPISCSPAVYKSTNSGSSWSEVYPTPDELPSSGQPLTTYASYTHALTIHPSNPDTLWYGGIGLYRSTDGGKSWTTVGNTSLHPDHHHIVVWESDSDDPAVKATGILAYAATDGGFFVGNGADVWNDGFQHGLQITQFQSISSSALFDYLIGGTQDNGANLYQGSDVWDHVDDGDAASTNVDRDKPETGKSIKTYDVSVGAVPQRCDEPDFCVYSWTPITTGLPVPETPHVSWYPPLVQDRNAIAGQHRFYFATNHLYRSTDDGDHWTVMTPPGGPVGGTATIAELAGIRNPISAVAVAPSDSNRIYIGYYDGQLWTTANGLSTDVSLVEWTRVDQHQLPNRPITSIAVSPTNPQRAFVSFTGFSQHSLYTTPDAGASWNPFDKSGDGGGFANNPVNVLFIQPTYPYRMWAGTDDGVYSRQYPYSDQLPWVRTSDGLPNVAVYHFDASANGTTIYAATHGRGVWAISLEPHLHVELACCCGAPCPGFGVNIVLPPEMWVHAWGFEPNRKCTLALLAKDRVCSKGARAADGATLATNADGVLVASRPGFYQSRPLSLLCHGGKCAGGVRAPRCNVSDVRVTCGRQLVQAPANLPLEAANPPSTSLGLLPASAVNGAGSFRLSPVLKKNGARSEVLCSSTVLFSADEDEETVLTRAAEGINADSRCRDAGVRAAVVGSRSAGTREDEGPKPFRLVLEAPRLSGIQLLTELTVSGPGAFSVDNYGVRAHRSRVVPQLMLSGTAQGGELQVTERSPLGSCTFSVKTVPGERAKTVAAKVQRAFLGHERAPTALRLSVGCHSRQNPRDVLRESSRLDFPLGQQLTVRNTDAGLTFKLGSDP